MRPLEIIPLERLKDLYAAVLMEGVKNALKWKKINNENHKFCPMQDKVWGEQALSWIFDDSPIFNGFIAICELLNFNHRKIRTDILTGNYHDPEASSQHWLRRYKFGEGDKNGGNGRTDEVTKDQRSNSRNHFVGSEGVDKAV